MTFNEEQELRVQRTLLIGALNEIKAHGIGAVVNEQMIAYIDSVLMACPQVLSHKKG